MNSSGTWSPDGKKFAFVIFEDGDNQFAILDVKSREIKRKIRINDAEAILDIAWSPDGQSIVVSGMEGGISDLHLYNFETDSTQKLTDDRHAQFQASWSSGGQKIVFA
ncbi:MAG: peptidase S9, partial [Aliifodinibius sp.]|nr:peptidase S9 [Fodinibius sp.]NIV11562.1 peptidase S9 [Fodinibius sp.]NIY25171.1 peptidase S9 [Fodinibius sp.]